MKTLNHSQLLRYSRHIMLPCMDLDGQEKLCQAKVLIIGVGGLGCAAAQYLTASGIGTLTLVDDDQVELSNLQRQVLHSDNDIGTDKVTSAKSSLQQLNQDVQINTLNRRLNDEELQQQIQQHQVVMDCSDNLRTRNQLNRLCFQAKVPLVSGAAIRMEGQVSVFTMQPGSPCYACLSQLFQEQQLSCSEAGVLSPVVGIIGSIQATETIKLLTGVGKPLVGQLLILDAGSMNFSEFVIQVNLHCKVCQKI